MAKDIEGSRALDACNGHSDVDRGYHYHVTPGRFPYVIGGYRGVPEPSNNRGLRHAGTGAIDDNAEGKSRMEAVIMDVRPGALPRGGRREVTIILDPAAARRGPVPAGTPSWAQIGPYEAVAIDRQGDAVTATFDIPADASVGMLLDCHIEFTPVVTGRPVVAFKRNDVMRVME